LLGYPCNIVHTYLLGSILTLAKHPELSVIRGSLLKESLWT